MEIKYAFVSCSHDRMMVRGVKGVQHVGNETFALEGDARDYAVLRVKSGGVVTKW